MDDWQTDCMKVKGGTRMEQKKGILVVSFGTSHLDTLERTITTTEQYIAG